MSTPIHGADRAKPDDLVGQLTARMGRHVLWDSLLLVLPPLIAALVAGYLCYRVGWLTRLSLALAAAALAGMAVLAVMLRYRPRLPSIAAAAQLIDRQADAKERFLTLATLTSAPAGENFLARLRAEAAGFGARVQLGRDFPYRVKKSFYRSLALSLLAALLLPWLIPPADSLIRPVSVAQRLRQVAAKMAQKESLKALAQEVNQLAAKLEDPKATPKEKQAAAEELEKKIEEQKKQEQDKENQDLLSQAANSLDGKEQQQAAGGDQQKKDQDKGGGGIQSNLPQEGKGEGTKQSDGGGSDGKGDQQSAQMSNDMKQGKSAQGNPKEKGDEKNSQGQGDAKSDQRDANQPGKEPSNEKTAKSQGKEKDGAGKSPTSEELPQGGAPAERFYKAGEGKDGGIKGKGYVTVQLPEDVAAESKADGQTSQATKESGAGKRTRAQLPVSNQPLPAHLPDAPKEKQPMPIEYRGIIR